MRFAVETWSPEYGVAADQGTLIESSATVDAGVEVALEPGRVRSVARCG